MHNKSYLGFWGLMFILISCSGNNPAMNQANPPTPLQNPVVPPANAFFKIGFIQKNFTGADSVACIFDKNNNEAVVTFATRDSGASLSFRLLGLGNGVTTHTLVNGRSKGVAFLSVGGSKNTNVFTLSANPSICVIHYSLSQTQMQASFQCDNIANLQGQRVMATGNWLCDTQTQKDWSW